MRGLPEEWEGFKLYRGLAQFILCGRFVLFFGFGFVGICPGVNDFIDIREAAPELGSALFPADEGIMRLFLFFSFSFFFLCPGIQTKLILSFKITIPFTMSTQCNPPALPCNL
jgi:hypothetical protein